MINSELGKPVNIPCHSPQVENEQTDSTKHGKNIVHRIDFILIVDELDQIEDQQEDESHECDSAQADIEAHEEVVFVGLGFPGDGRIGLKFLFFVNVTA